MNNVYIIRDKLLHVFGIPNLCDNEDRKPLTAITVSELL